MFIFSKDKELETSDNQQMHLGFISRYTITGSLKITNVTVPTCTTH